MKSKFINTVVIVAVIIVMLIATPFVIYGYFPEVIPDAEENGSPYISPNELVERWRCSRSSVDRIVRRAGIGRACLGEGVNGMIRFIRREVEEFGLTRCI